MEPTTKADQTVSRIRALMERTGWNQAQTAAYLGVPQGTLGNWLAATRSPNTVVVRLLDVLGMVESLAPWLHDTMTPATKEQG
jgi:DNA-binding transcriptional regulator YiaG